MGEKKSKTFSVQSPSFPFRSFGGDTFPDSLCSILVEGFHASDLSNPMQMAPSSVTFGW